MDEFRAQVEKAGLKVFDYALPQGWVDEVMKKTGKWPYGFVWCYDDASIFGKPVAITEEAKQMEEEFNVSVIG